jgi:hypothetical protein
MKLTLLLVLLPVTALVVNRAVRQRAARREAAAAAARARALRNSRIPVVSNNLKGVTAAQASPRPSRPEDTGERAA